MKYYFYHIFEPQNIRIFSNLYKSVMDTWNSQLDELSRLQKLIQVQRNELIEARLHELIERSLLHELIEACCMIDDFLGAYGYFGDEWLDAWNALDIREDVKDCAISLSHMQRGYVEQLGCLKKSDTR